MKKVYTRDRRSTISYPTIVVGKLITYYRHHGWEVTSVASFLSALVEEHERLLNRIDTTYAELTWWMTFEDAEKLLKDLKNTKVSQSHRKLVLKELRGQQVFKHKGRAEYMKKQRWEGRIQDYTPPIHGAEDLPGFAPGDLLTTSRYRTLSLDRIYTFVTANTSNYKKLLREAKIKGHNVWAVNQFTLDRKLLYVSLEKEKPERRKEVGRWYRYS